MNGTKRIAAMRPDGALVCGGCIEVLYSKVGGDMADTFGGWIAWTVDDIAQDAQDLFLQIKDDAADQYPDMEAIDPRFIAQIDAMPYCDTCGVFLADFGKD